MARRPYSGATVSGYGPRVAPIAGASTWHRGVDGIGGGMVVAPEAGRVVSVGYSGGWGNLVTMLGDSGTTHRLAHIAPGGFRVSAGQRIAEGQAAGVMGMTRTATGVHVHWETLKGGAQYDPETWLSSQAATAFVDNGRLNMATLGITSNETGDHYRFFRPYGLDDRAVIINGTHCVVFPNQGQLSHFLNFNRLGTPASIERVVETVGGPSESAKWNRDVFKLIAKMHGYR